MDKSEVEKELEKLLERQTQIDRDYNYARDNWIRLIEDGMAKQELLGTVCESSEHPRAFEVYSKLLKDLGDMQDKFMEHQRKKQIVDSETTMEIIRLKEQFGATPMLEAKLVEYQEAKPKYFGSTSEMQKMLSQKKNHG